MNADQGEFAFIDWLRQRSTTDASVAVGIGDDCAVTLVPATTRQLLVTTDMLLEGSCFLLDEAGPRAVGRKAMAVNLSDIAAMAGVPRWAVVSVGLPRQRGRTIAEEIYLGLREMADAFGTLIVGGDTNSWDGPLTLSVTLIGESLPPGPCLRRGAKPGDWLLVTGTLGGSILGKHLTFTPRVREAQILQRHGPIHAMIDISDGLSRDVGHICQASGCGVILDAWRIPLSADAHRLAEQTGKSPVEHALTDGEDFELAFAVEPSIGQRLLEEQPLGEVRIAHIGEFIPAGFYLRDDTGVHPYEPRGYSHPLE